MFDASRPTIGLVGLGKMGGPLAERLLGHTALAVFDQSPDRAKTFVERGATIERSIGAATDIVFIVFNCLPPSADVRCAVIGDSKTPGLAAGLKAGGLIVDMTTGIPEATRQMAAELAPREIDLIDTPVFGGPRGARDGTIAIIVGGSAAQFARVSPLLGMISSNVIYAGPVGAGHAVNAGNNLLNLICRLATFELSRWVKEGVDPATATAIIQKSFGSTALMQKDSNDQHLACCRAASLRHHDLGAPDQTRIRVSARQQRLTCV